MKALTWDAEDRRKANVQKNIYMYVCYSGITRDVALSRSCLPFLLLCFFACPLLGARIL